MPIKLLSRIQRPAKGGVYWEYGVCRCPFLVLGLNEKDQSGAGVSLQGLGFRN
jgi:hypothetical protein